MDEQYNHAPQTQNNYVRRRSVGLCIFFLLITCGIYGLYWIYALTEDVNDLSKDRYATSGGMVILFSIITCGIYGLYWLYQQGDCIDRLKNDRGIASSNSGILYLIIGIFGFHAVSLALMQAEVNRLAD